MNEDHVPIRRWRLFVERCRASAGRPSLTWRELARTHRLLAVSAAIAVGGVLLFDAWVATCAFNGCPSAAEIRAFRPPEGGRILDRDDRLIGRMRYIRRVNVALDTVPEHVRQAFLDTEDRRFYAHRGVDWWGFARAVVHNVVALDVREGFSTITMQAARNTFIAERRALERTLGRKLIELRLARLMERSLTKDQIFELYLNAIYMGNGMYGVEAASRDLFGKSVAKVDVSEGAMLAGLPKAPSAYTPRRDRKRATARRDVVLGLMARSGHLSPDRLERARKSPLKVASKEWRPPQPDDSYAVDAVRHLVDSVLTARGLAGSEVVVYTTVDRDAQRAADRAVRRHAASIEREAVNARGRSARGIEGAMVALDPRTGDILALVGGRRFERKAFNRALDAHRQPGSAFKPFVYAAALSHGFTPASLVNDEPVRIEQDNRIWTPANYGDEYLGRITLRRALMKSANSATVRVSRSVGEPNVVEAARRNGITSPLQPVPAIALGALEVTPLELVTAYAPFGNGGYRVEPRLVRRIETVDGQLIWERETERRAVMDPRDAFQLTGMLRGVVDFGTGSAVRAYGVTGPVAGKTGTTNEGADVWFVGYTPTIVAGFWFGYDTPRQIAWNASGGRLAAPAWAEFYRQGWQEHESGDGWEPPAGMVSAVIDAETGLLAGEYCPHRIRTWFKPGTEPTEYCHEHDWDVYDWMDDFRGRLGDALRKIRIRF